MLDIVVSAGPLVSSDNLFSLKIQAVDVGCGSSLDISWIGACSGCFQCKFVSNCLRHARVPCVRPLYPSRYLLFGVSQRPRRVQGVGVRTISAGDHTDYVVYKQCVSDVCDGV